MNFDISAVGADMSSIPVPSRATPPAAAEPDHAVKLAVIPTTPPDEVHAAMAAAAHTFDRLSATDRLLHFTIDDQTGVLHVEVHDTCGRLLFEVPPSKALDVAAGQPLE